MSLNISNILSKLIEAQDLSYNEVKECTKAIAEGKINESQLSAFLVLLATKGETSEEISAMAQVMQQYVKQLDLSDTHITSVVDIVGTGGDGFNTVNISTAASILTSACGVVVTKHGSTSVSSSSGSSDVLLKLCNSKEHIANNKILKTFLKKNNYAFLYAPYFHPAMKQVVPTRKSLKVRTVFNILGPLLNPILATASLSRNKKLRFSAVLGVYSPKLLGVYAEVIKNLGVDHALIVHGSGMDELNTCGIVEAYEVKKGEDIKQLIIDPQELGLSKCTPTDLRGGSPEENAEIIREVFRTPRARKDNGKYDSLRETIALNAAAALYVEGKAGSLKEGLSLAIRILDSGDALVQLNKVASSWNESGN